METEWSGVIDGCQLVLGGWKTGKGQRKKVGVEGMRLKGAHVCQFRITSLTLYAGPDLRTMTKFKRN